MANDQLAVRERGEMLSDEVLSPVMNLQVAKQRLAEFQSFIKDYLKEGEDFGTIPGTPKPTLLKPGADKLCELYGLSDAYEVVDKVEDFDAHPPLFDYTIRCVLTKARNGMPVSEGLGSCNSYEARYRYREGGRKCPKCQSSAIIKGKAEYGGGFICFQKKGGCGAKFNEDDATITKQVVGKVENDDLASQKNTILKMAKKRAKIDATLSATRSSGVFTQDMEDIAAGAAEPVSSGTTQPPTKPKGKPAPKGREENLDVVCSECRATNSHAPTCSYHAKNKKPSDDHLAQYSVEGKGAPLPEPEIQKPSTATRELFIDGVENATTKVVMKEGKKTGGNPFLRLKCLDADQNGLTVCVFHATPQKYAPKWVGMWAKLELNEKKGSTNTVYSLQAVHRVGDVEYRNNEPVVAAEDENQDAGPDAEQMGFDQA